MTLKEFLDGMQKGERLEIRPGDYNNSIIVAHHKRGKNGMLHSISTSTPKVHMGMGLEEMILMDMVLMRDQTRGLAAESEEL